MLKKIILFIIVVLFSLSLSLEVKAAQKKSYGCTDPEAPWNQAEGISPVLFKCKAGIVNGANIEDTSDKNKYTMIVNYSGCKSSNGKKTLACVRISDCESLYGGEGYSCIRGVGGSAKYLVKKYHCPAGDDFTCAKLKAAPEEEKTIETPETELPVVSSTPRRPLVIPLSGCCQQIVPIIDHTVEDYGLNHLLQVGINIYKCILCIVGSLMILMIVLGGFTMVYAAGDSGKISSGKKMITAAIIGGIIVLSSYLIVSFAVYALGADFSDPAKLEINPGN